jgi:hypothetical protein
VDLSYALRVDGNVLSLLCRCSWVFQARDVLTGTVTVTG